MENYQEEFKSFLSLKKNYSQNTVNSYISDIGLFLRYLGEEGILVEEVTKNTIMSYLSYLRKMGKSSSTSARYLAAVRLYFHFLMLEKIIPSNPCEDVKVARDEKKTPQVLSLQEIENLLSSPNTGTKKGRRDKAMLELLYATGMRAGEIILLKAKDINLSLNYCICSSGSKNRLIPFGKKAGEAIKNYIGSSLIADDSYLFSKTNGQPLSRQGFWKIIKEYAQKAGLDSSISPSMLRNSFAAHMIYNGADLESVQELMGFADINALNAYGKNNKKRIMDVYSSSHPRA